MYRCRDEFGQLNARVLGIKKVRQTVMDGWNSGKGTDQASSGGNEAGEGGVRAKAGKGPGGGRGGVPRNEGGVGQKNATGMW